MSRHGTRMVWLWVWALGFCAGCANEPQGSLAPLPSPRIEFGPAAADALLPADMDALPSPELAGDAEWAARTLRPWRHIVIHHSASSRGSASIFDAAHRRRGFDELGYHFVITNGDGGPDGAVEVGPRWRRQKWGAHCGKTPRNEYNNYGIGICLVGDFRGQMPTQRQLDSLRRLVTYLAARCDIPAQNIIGHGDAPGAATACPGDKLSEYIAGPLRASVSPLAAK